MLGHYLATSFTTSFSTTGQLPRTDTPQLLSSQVGISEEAPDTLHTSDTQQALSRSSCPLPAADNRKNTQALSQIEIEIATTVQRLVD